MLIHHASCTSAAFGWHSTCELAAVLHVCTKACQAQLLDQLVHLQGVHERQQCAGSLVLHAGFAPSAPLLS